jgi:hypothetical protein
MRLEPHSTRLFPKHRGADAYRLTGIAARCDWVVLSDREEPRVQLVRRHPERAPQHVFLSLRSPFDALRFMAREVLPMLTEPFALVSGSEDVTLPNQLDQRWRKFDAEERDCIQAILGHPLLRSWFVENLDDRRRPLMTPMPVGLVFPEGGPSDGLVVPEVTALLARPRRILCAHRTRPGPQWELRRQASALARGPWAEWCTVLDEELPEPDFLALLAQHAFVLCVEGGGLDPSPKAWQAMLHVAIPIVSDTALREAHARLPVAFVAEWTAPHIDVARLDGWLSQLGPLQDDPRRREETLRRLGLDDWWDRVCASVSTSPAGPTRRSAHGAIRRRPLSRASGSGT